MDITIYRNQLKLDADLETRKAGMFQIAKDRPEELNEAQMGMEESDLTYFEGSASRELMTFSPCCTAS